VQDNPTAGLARAADGRTAAGRPVVGRVLEVSYDAGLNELIQLAHDTDAIGVIGLGVAARAERVRVETVALNATLPERPDAVGACPPDLGRGPERLELPWNPDALVRVLDGERSVNAGRYVCNAWLYTALLRLDVPAVFVHVPPSGLEDERLHAALEWAATAWAP
jgi:pyrrolidone-carboxylate peptidase